MNNFGRKLAEKIGINVQGGTVHVGEIRLDSEMSRQEFRNRQALLNLVKTAWVEGVLEKSLHEQIPIVLGLEKRESAVASPWNLNFIKADQEPEPLPAGTPVIDVFDKLGAGGTLLILGEPGSGKTITLLQLARDLIKRAEDDGSYRIPVVLNLSSWAVGKQNIAQWIVEELNSKYQINKKIGQQWVEKQELLLLLDGLDEIRDLKDRNACVMALNTFQQKQATEIVVCCRVQDYGKLGNKLRLQSALALQPLTSDQIQGYLNRLQSNLTVLRKLLTEDTTLQDLANSPLLLNIMVLAYQGIDFAEVPQIPASSNRKKQLFEDYINRMFQSSRLAAYNQNSQSLEKQAYSRKDTTRWLVWMAQRMVEYSQVMFLIERIQPYWLNSIEVIFYRIGNLLILVVIIGLINILSFGIILGLFFGIISGTIFGLINGLILQVETVESVKWSWKEFNNNFIRWLIKGLIFGLIGGIIFGVKEGISIGMILGLVDGLYVGLIGGLIFALTSGIIVGGIGGLISGITGSLITSVVEIRNYSNQGIRKSALNSLIYGLFLGMIVGLVYSLVGMPQMGFIAGLIGWSFFGGSACIQHFVLRMILYFTGCIP